MALKRLTIEQCLGLDKFIVDERAHIILNKELCRTCADKPCTVACPAGLYKFKDGEVEFDYAGCLECGTCRAVCPKSGTALIWTYPNGGFGVSFRYG